MPCRSWRKDRGEPVVLQGLARLPRHRNGTSQNRFAPNAKAGRNRELRFVKGWIRERSRQYHCQLLRSKRPNSGNLISAWNRGPSNSKIGEWSWAGAVQIATTLRVEAWSRHAHINPATESIGPWNYARKFKAAAGRRDRAGCDGSSSLARFERPPCNRATWWISRLALAKAIMLRPPCGRLTLRDVARRWDLAKDVLTQTFSPAIPTLTASANPDVWHFYSEGKMKPVRRR